MIFHWSNLFFLFFSTQKRFLKLENISFGYTHMSAISSKKEIKTWGDNEFGQLGQSTQASFEEPVAIKLKTYETSNKYLTSIANGQFFTVVAGDKEAFSSGVCCTASHKFSPKNHTQNQFLL